MNRRLARNSVFLSLLLATSVAFAADEHQDVVPDPMTFEEQRELVEEELDGELYYEISQGDKRKVLEALERMSVQLEGKSSLDELSEESKLAVFNDQELVNELLTGAAEDSRMICRREKKLGSNMPVNVCMSAAQRRQAREHAQDAARRTTIYLEREG